MVHSAGRPHESTVELWVFRTVSGLGIAYLGNLYNQAAVITYSRGIPFPDLSKSYTVLVLPRILGRLGGSRKSLGANTDTALPVAHLSRSLGQSPSAGQTTCDSREESGNTGTVPHDATGSAEEVHNLAIQVIQDFNFGWLLAEEHLSASGERLYVGNVVSATAL